MKRHAATLALLLAALTAATVHAQAPPQGLCRSASARSHPARHRRAQGLGAAAAAARADRARVQTAAELTAALLDEGTLPIRLAPGTYVGNFTIAKAKRIAGVADLPEARITAAQVAAVRLQAADRTRPVLTVLGSDVSVEGLTLTGAAPDRDTVLIGSASATTVEELPHRVTFDRVAVLADPAGGHRGLAMHGVDIALRRSFVDGFVEQGRDSQAVWILNGPGPFVIEDNWLSASGENILLGGGRQTIPGVNPSAIVRGNTLYKPQVWRTRTGSVKNSFEVKCGVGVLLEGNIIDGNWRDAQAGSTILVTAKADLASPWLRPMT